MRFAADEINSAVDDLQACVKGLSGQAPECSELDTFASCVSTAANVLGGLSSTKAVGAEVARLEKGISRLNNAVSLVHAQCKQGCQGGDCSAASLAFHVPDGCQCKTMTLTVYDGQQSVTPDSCARNTATFNKTSASSSSSSSSASVSASNYTMALSAKVSFTYMGCYVAPTKMQRSGAARAQKRSSQRFSKAPGS